MTMEEWKAAERTKLHAASLPPETLAQDNAFPVFPTYRDKSRPPGDRSAAGSAMGHRSSLEQRRPSTSSGVRSEGRPGVSRDNSYNNQSSPPNAQQQLERPSMDHKPFSFEPVKDRPVQQQSPPPSQQQRPQDQPSASNSAATSTQERRQQQRPMNDQRQSPPNGQAEKRPATAHTNGSTRQNSGEAQAQYQDSRSAQQQTRPGLLRGMPPIDTHQAQQQPQRSGYMDHQPLSPAQVPPRPSTAQGARSPLSQSMTSPTSAYSSAQTPFDSDRGQAPPVPSKAPQVKQDSLGDIYGGYADNRMPPPVTGAPPRTREEEIEAEMPDFDSAAPGGTSLLYKRNQTVEKHLAGAPQPAVPLMPNMQAQHANVSAASLPVQNQRFYNQQQDATSMSFPDQRGPKQKQGEMTEGFVFGIPGENAQQQQYEDPYQQRLPPQQQRSLPYQQGGARPVQPPFANEQRPRRSMDDAREIHSSRHGTQQARRVQQNGQPIRGPQPLQQRPDVGRNLSNQTVLTTMSEPAQQSVGSAPSHQQHFQESTARVLNSTPFAQQRPDLGRNFSNQTVQTTMSEPVQQRVGSAPPQRQQLQEPPGRAPMGAPLTQQRSAPEQQDPQQHRHRHSNPDTLPHHPTPVRPGLMGGGAAQVAKPPPVRNYDSSAPSHSRQTSIDTSSRPVTAAELEQLRQYTNANPNNNKQALVLAQKLVEAANVLASEGGRADPRTAAKNRERYIMDAHKRVKKLVQAGYPEAQFYLADCYGQGALGLEVDTKEAFNLYQAAAKAGHAEAAYRTAMCCEMGPEDGGGTRRDYARAVQWYRRAAALGDAAGMYKLGIVLLRGLLGQQRNIGEAVNWLKRAVERGQQDNPNALHELATLYESANTNLEVRNKVVADDAYALDLFQQAANLGNKVSQFRLGQAYEYGALGVTIDNRTSISWYSKAAAKGEHEAELALSGWYLTGAEGILEHSDTEAYLWARKAASSEPPLAKAMFAMGYFAETGIGCPANLDEARRWYGRAACKLCVPRRGDNG